MFKKFLITLTAFIAVMVLCCAPVPAAASINFSSDFTMTDASGKQFTGKIFIKGDKIRQEVKMQGQTSISIVRGDKQICWTLLPGNQYMETALTANPGQPQKDLDYKVKSLGKETVNGYVCKVTQYTYQKTKYGTLVQWSAEKLGGYPVKFQTKNAQGKITSTTEYKNIKIEKPADSLFELPSGYQKMKFQIPGYK